MSYLLLGLGNPGTDYEKTRHNAGYIFVDSLIYLTSAKRYYSENNFLMWKFMCGDEDVYLVKPLTFMNLSGLCLNRVLLKSKVSLGQMCVICDNLDLDLGRAKLKRGGGSAGQKGLQNIINLSRMPDFWRLYIGIGRPKEFRNVCHYVIGRFSQDYEIQYFNLCKELAQDFYLGLGQGFMNLQKIINEKWKKIS